MTGLFRLSSCLDVILIHGAHVLSADKIEPLIGVVGKHDHIVDTAQHIDIVQSQISGGEGDAAVGAVLAYQAVQYALSAGARIADWLADAFAAGFIVFFCFDLVPGTRTRRMGRTRAGTGERRTGIGRTRIRRAGIGRTRTKRRI